MADEDKARVKEIAAYRWRDWEGVERAFLSAEEVEALVNEAASHEEEDKARRELVEKRNQLDNFIYQTEKLLKENGESVPEELRTKLEAAIVEGRGPGLDGSSFAATQQWVHNLDDFEAMPQDERDNIIGRRLSDNEELDGAPASAHVKRTEQESFDPEAFVVRRSMPWAEGGKEGLMFVAFGKSLDAFEAQLKRMTGQEDGVIDGLFRFSRPISGSDFLCPPVLKGCLDLTAIGV